MSVARVYRPQYDWKSQRVHANLEDDYIGDLTGVIVGGASPQAVGRFPGVVSTEGLLGVPYEQDSGVELQQRDMILLSGILYAVTGPRQWEEDHAFAGTDVTEDYYWIGVEASHGGP